MHVSPWKDGDVAMTRSSYASGARLRGEGGEGCSSVESIRQRVATLTSCSDRQSKLPGNGATSLMTPVIWADV